MLLIAALLRIAAHCADRRFYKKQGEYWAREGFDIMRERYRMQAKEKQCYWEEGSIFPPNECFWPDGSVKRNFGGNTIFEPGLYWRNSDGRYASLTIERKFNNKPGATAPKE